MNKIYYKLLVLALAIVSFSSCTSEERDLIDLSGNTDIQSFVINGVEGVINPDNSTITVILPSGTDLHGLIPEISLGNGAIVSPASGVAMDFADANNNLKSIIYLVSNKDTYQKYTVNVDVARAKITNFKIGSVEADIDEANKEIVLWLAKGTDITALIPVVEYTDGAELSPASGSAVDFTNPVVFTLNYLGSTFSYTVKVNLGEKPLENLIVYDGEKVIVKWAALGPIPLTNNYLNPLTNGINTTANCIMVNRSPEGQAGWNGGALWNENAVNIDPTIYGSFTLMILKEVAGDVQLEIQSAGEANKDWLHADYSAEHLGEWQMLTFNIPAGRTAVINNILVMPHNVNAGFTAHQMYWDQLIAIPKVQ